MSSRTRSHFAGSQSAPSTSSMRDHSERRGGHKSRRSRELTCETCGKHPVCLQKHRWEHNPLWRDTAQLLLSKHQQVQVMEAAAILIHGAALPPDRALWPSYMSGGTLQSPVLAGDGTLREMTPQVQARAISPVPTISSAAREDPPSDGEELEELEEDDEEEQPDETQEEQVDEEDETDESDVPLPQMVSTPSMGTRGRSQSLAAPVTSHMPNLYGSYGVGSHGYGWGVIGEQAVNKSPAFDAHTSLIASPRSPMAIPSDATLRSPTIPHVPAHHHGHHHSISSFGSFTSSASSFVPFGSASTSSYIPSSSVRSGGVEWQSKGEEEDEDVEGMEMDDDTFVYGSRASSLYKRLAAVTGNTPPGAFVTSSINGGVAVVGKSTSLERRREEYMYEMDMD